jgi:tetratricopeptide (TPR) repeat protein
LLCSDEYRVRAIAAFFPFMNGLTLKDAGNVDGALGLFNEAILIGYDVDWLKTNMTSVFAHWGYEELAAGRLVEAQKVYRRWLIFDLTAVQAASNLGVVLERMGLRDDAKAQYEWAMEKFPDAVDPVYNLAVLAWGEKDWPGALLYFEETLKRKPDHPTAGKFRDLALKHVEAGQ